MKLPYSKKLQTLAVSASLLIASCLAAPGIALAHGGHHHGGGGHHYHGGGGHHYHRGGRHWHHTNNAAGVGLAFGAVAFTMAAIAASHPRPVYQSNCQWRSRTKTRCHYDRWGNTICRPVRVNYQVCYN